MPVTRKQLLAQPRSGARPLEPAAQAERARNTGLAPPWLPAATPAGAQGQPHPPTATTGRAAPAASATRPGQASAQRSRDAVAAHPQRAGANGVDVAAALPGRHGPHHPADRRRARHHQEHDRPAGHRATRHRCGAVARGHHPAVRRLVGQTPAAGHPGGQNRRDPRPATRGRAQLALPRRPERRRTRHSRLHAHRPVALLQGHRPCHRRPLGKQRNLAAKQRHPDLAAVQAGRDAADAGWRIRYPRHQAEVEAEPEAV